MKKKVLLAAEFSEQVIEDQAAFKLDLAQSDIPDLCLSLCLLREELVSQVCLQSNGKLGLCLERSESTNNRLVRSPTLSLQMTRTELERLVYFFLTYYRDGWADVDHIDVEADDDVPNRMAAYVIFVVPAYKPPVSADEAKRRLGID